MTISDQEVFWRGAFGDEYVERNRGNDWVASNSAFFSRVLSRTHDVRSVLELGANIGLNLMAFRQLLPKAQLSAVEINEKAAKELKTNLPDATVAVASIFDFESNHRTWDFVFSKGVFIHLDPSKLPTAYEVMHRSSSRYILVAEYYSPRPVEIMYRGHTGKLFKRDFAGEMLDRFSDLSLLDYGFTYHRDHNFPQDDINWFLLEKRTAA